MTIRTFKSGDSREQSNLLPPRIEDYVGLDNPVRAIDVFVGALDFAKLGFKHADRGVGVGQPPYDPSDLLKLYLYGYVNQIRSSRRLEREAGRNLELMARRERAQADLNILETSDKGQLSKTDPDARLLSKGDQTIAGYNVQSVVDDKHMLIVASDVVNRNDTGHLHEMAKAAKEVLDVETLQAAADTAYYNSEDLKACEDDGIVAYVPLHEGNGKLEKEGRFSRKDFSYDASADAY